MVIKKSVLNQIYSFIELNADKESGGLLGKKEDIITNVILDFGLSNHRCTYEPNIDLFNNTIVTWQLQGIDFAGIYHTHFFGISTLSPEDIAYAKEILLSMPNNINQLYFPIVLPEDMKIIPYIFRKKTGYVCFESEVLRIVE